MFFKLTNLRRFLTWHFNHTQLNVETTETKTPVVQTSSTSSFDRRGARKTIDESASEIFHKIEQQILLTESMQDLESQSYELEIELRELQNAIEEQPFAEFGLADISPEYEGMKLEELQKLYWEKKLQQSDCQLGATAIKCQVSKPRHQVPVNPPLQRSRITVTDQPDKDSPNSEAFFLFQLGCAVTANEVTS